MIKHIFSLITISFLLFMPSNLFAEHRIVANNEKPIALFVEFQFETKHMNQAIELLTEMQNQTIENEEVCIAYDVFMRDEEPNTIYIYEFYENIAALDIHNQTSYYKEIVGKKLPTLIKEQKILKLTPLNDLEIIM